MKSTTLVGALLLLPLPALAGLEFCNETDANVSIAIGYLGPDGWTSEGWWNYVPGECGNVIGGDLPLSHYYWRAESDDMSFDHARYMFCTAKEEFTIVGDENCAERGYDRQGFNEIALEGATSFTMTVHGNGDGGTPGPQAPMTSAPTPEANAAPGTFGEPYSITGLLSHCDWYDEGLGCTVLADGWRYVATSYDHTPVDTLVTLDELGVNVPVSISGDMISHEGNEALVTIRAWQAGGDDPYAAMRRGLQGLWTSTDDASYQVLIHGAVFEEYYDQMPQDDYTMMFQDGCPGAPGDGPAFQLVMRDGGEDRCVFASSVSPTELELFVAGTMRPLLFRRED